MSVWVKTKKQAEITTFSRVVNAVVVLEACKFNHMTFVAVVVVGCVCSGGGRWGGLKYMLP